MRLVSSNDALIALRSRDADRDPAGTLDPRDAELAHLREVVAQYEALFQNAPVLINAFDEQGKCLLWNEACERRFGWRREEINRHAEPLALFYPDPEIRARVIDSVGRAPHPSFREWQPLARNGERLSVMWSNVRLPDGSVVNIGMDMTENRRNEAALARQAKVDGLTGCWTRAEILQRMKGLLETAKRGARHTALMLDLDHFKQINDRHGHAAGDQVLIRFTETVRGMLRASDLLGRTGGEEFSVLLPEADAQVALAIAERIRSGVEALRIDLEDGQPPLRVTVSIGIAPIAPGATFDQMAVEADKALYAAKNGGRNRVAWALADASRPVGGQPALNAPMVCDTASPEPTVSVPAALTGAALARTDAY